jgi:hypothetical protein
MCTTSWYPARIVSEKGMLEKAARGQRKIKRLHNTVGPLAFIPISGSQAWHDPKGDPTPLLVSAERGAIRKCDPRAEKRKLEENPWNEYPQYSLLSMMFTWYITPQR